jgi:hypothetical protein
MSRHYHRRRHPQKRMIQYSEPLAVDREARGVLDTRFRGYDDRVCGGCDARRTMSAVRAKADVTLRCEDFGFWPRSGRI